MKKILSLFVTAAMLTASCVIPASADDFDLMGYEASEYDISRVEKDYNDDAAATEINTLDNTAAKKITADSENVIEFQAADKMFSKEFFVSMDVRYDEVDGEYPGNIGITRNGKVGPQIRYKGGKLVNELSKDTTLGDFEAGKWYTFEFEGKMSVQGAKVAFRVYDGNGAEPVINVDNLELRNFYGGTTHGDPNYLFVTKGLSVDNVKFISLNPDTITITSDADEIKAGSTTGLDYTMSRKGVEYTKYNVEYSVYDESDTTEITEDVSINDGVLAASISAPDQTVTVRATAQFGDKTLIGTKKIKINSVDVSAEKFDTVEINGISEMKAGTSESFTAKVFKDGADVTSTLEDGDVVWSVYNCDDLNPNNSREFKIENGTLTVADSALPQTIYVRASSNSGNVYGSKQIKLSESELQVEALRGYDACEAANPAASRVESFDGSTAYYTNSALSVTHGNTTAYVLTELDIRFDQEGGGFILKRADGTENSSFKLHSGSLAQQTGGSSWSTITGVSTDKWYHVEVLYSATNADASCNIYEYDENGEKTLIKTATDLNRRNGKDYGRLEIQAGTYVDNIKISTPSPNQLDIKASRATMFAGETNQVTATVSRNGLPIKSATNLTWTVLDEEMLPIIDGSVTAENGLVTVDPMAKEQTITVEASTATGEKQTVAITIMSSEIFSMKNIGVNEDKTKVVKLYVDKNFIYQDDVLFVMAFYDADGVLKAARVLSTYGSNYPIGSNEITVDWDIPGGFDPETENASVFIWTGLK